MSDFNFEDIRPFDPALSERLQAKIAWNIGPRGIVGPGPERGRARSARFSLGEGVPRPFVPPPPGPDPGPDPGPGPGPGSDPTSALFVRSNHYGGRVLTFNFQGATGGGGGNNEIRVSPYLDYEHVETKALWIVPYSGVTAGQFLQVRRSIDDDVANTALPTGTLMGSEVGRTGVYPAPDNTQAIPVPFEPTLLDTFRVGWNGGFYIKLRLFFVAPAVALPVISVMLSVIYRPTPGAYLFAARS